MAISATFAADFSSFFDAVSKADVKVRGLDGSAKFAERGLSRMVDTFSGTKLIREATLATEAVDRIGGTSKLTEGELRRLGNQAAEAAEKMRKMGVDVPPKLDALAKHAQKPTGAFHDMLGAISKIGPALGVSLSVGAVTSFAKGVGEFAGKMTDLSAQTQIGTSRLQAFNFTGAGAGLTIEQITDAGDQLAKRIGEGDSSVVGALDKLNLHAADLKTLGLDEVLFRIDKGLVGVGNQFDRAAILADLFGRSGAKLGRIFDGNLRQVIEATEKSGAIIDEELIKKADDFDDKWTQAVLQVKATAVNAFGAIGRAIEEAQMIAKRGVRFGVSAPPATEWQRNMRPLEPGQRIQGGIVGTDSDFGIVQGGGIRSVIEESKLDVELRKWTDETAKAAAATASWARNLEGEARMAQDVAFFHSVTSEAAKKLQALAMRAGTPGILPNLNGGLTAGLMFGPGTVNQNPFGGVLSKLPQSFAGGLSGGLDKLLEGFTGGGGTGGFLNKLGGSLVGGVGNVLGGALTGGISSLIGLGVSGLGKLFGGLFKNEGKETNRLRDSSLFDFTGISGDKGAAQARFREMATEAGIASAEVDRLFSTGKIKAFEADFARLTGKIREFTNEQDADAARLTAAIEKYGIAFEEAGAAFQKQRLDEQAKELIEDWRVLVGSGIDIGVVNEKMAESINDYLQTAIKVGQDVPNAMRPILQKMLEQGTLTDEAGNAITDMEAAGISFSETMTEGFDRVVKKLDELITKLGAAGEALGNVSVPSGFVNTDGLSASDIVPMARGGRGRVTRPTLFLAGEAGPEDVAFSGAHRRFGGDAGLREEVVGLRADMTRLWRTLGKEIAAQQQFALAQRT